MRILLFYLKSYIYYKMVVIYFETKLNNYFFTSEFLFGIFNGKVWGLNSFGFSVVFVPTVIVALLS